MPYTLGWIALTAFDWFLLKLGAAPMNLFRWLWNCFTDCECKQCGRYEIAIKELTETLEIARDRELRILYFVERKARRLHESTKVLAAAACASIPHLFRRQGDDMNPILQQLHDAVAAQKTVADSVVTLLNGIPARIQAAIDAALAGSVTAQQLADAVGVELAAITSNTSELSAAVTANTPSAPPAP